MFGRMFRVVVYTFAAAASSQTVEEPSRVYEFPWMPGLSALQVDGSLSDWGRGILPVALESSNYGGGSSSSAADPATAAFRAFADDNFVYFGIEVAAERYRFETARFNEFWKNDSVELFLFNSPSTVGSYVRHGLIRLSADSSGRAVMEGAVSVSEGSGASRGAAYPLLWQLLGAEGSLRPMPGGYSAEIAIPRLLLGWAPGANSDRFKINVRVRRNYEGFAARNVVEWARDPYNSSFHSYERYRSVSFTQHATVDAGPAAARQGAIASVVLAALERIDNSDATGAVMLLQQLSANKTTWPFMASAQIAAGDFPGASTALQRIIDSGPDETLRSWAREHLALVKRRLGDAAGEREQYRTAATSSVNSIRDAGVAGLIDCELREDRPESAADMLKGFSKHQVLVKSAARLGISLREHKRFDDAKELFKSIADSAAAHDAERGWALLQLQQLHAEVGDRQQSMAAGWRLQSTALPGDPSALAGLLLLRTISEGQQDNAEPDWLVRYLNLANERKLSMDPARELVVGQALAERKQWQTARSIYRRIAERPETAAHEKAEALLGLQELDVARGQLQSSIQMGLTLQKRFRAELTTRYSSWKLLRRCCTSRDTPQSVQQQCESVQEGLVSDLRNHGASNDPVKASEARNLLIGLSREVRHGTN